MAHNESERRLNHIKNNAGRPGLNRLYTKYHRLTTNGSNLSTNLDLFMQNKANFQKVKFYATYEMTRTYAKWTLGVIGKTKPNKANSKPIKKMPKMNVSRVLTKEYEKCQIG